MLQEPLAQVVKGYELREQIGEGGYGVVYRAYQPLVGRDVAVKVILPQYANQPDFIRRFESEAQLVARLEHPHIVPLYDYWREPDSAYLVMRWLRGGSLHQALTGGPLPLETIGRFLDQIGGALAVAHRRSVIHRDLKPANILLDEDGNAYLADFGIAKDLGKGASPYQTDQVGVLGSPAYISPEQIKAEPITPQTDIYSLGVMLYEILTGELPFQAPTPIAMLFKHINDTMPSLHDRRPDLDGDLDDVIQKATAKNPADSYGSVTTLVRDFQQAIAPGQAGATAQLSGAPGATPIKTDGGRATGASRTRSKYETGVLYLPTSVLPVIETVVENPYKGLRAFQEADAADFFGRDMLTQVLLARMQEATPLARFLAVVGPSGSGKSSVVRAGVVPAIRKGALPGSQDWFVVEMFPGAHPLEELEQALLRVAVNPPDDMLAELQQDEHGLLRVIDRIVPGWQETQVVLVIDQFEELFTLVEDEDVRVHFLNTLITAAIDPRSRVRVIVTLRADFYDRPLMYQGFSELMRQRTEVVVPLGEEELKQAIVSPAERNGMKVDPELVEAIINDVGEQPGALPLLQYALTEVFERRSGRTLTLTPYQASGGVLGALARRADEIFIGLDEARQEVTRQLFLRLVTLGEGVEDTRRRVRRTELLAVGADNRALDAVIETYSQYRLLTLDHDPITRAPTVEVAHEALIRTWIRLRQWLDASREDLRLQRRVAAAATEWQNSGHERSFLASGARLEQLATWAYETPLALNAEERAYLDASLAERDAQLAQEQARKAHEVALERRSRTFLRALAAVLLVAFVLALGLSLYAFQQQRVALQSAAAEATAKAQADINAAEAKQNANDATNLALAAGVQNALLQDNTGVALTLAVAANQVPKPLIQAQFALAQAAYAPGTRLVLSGHKREVRWVAFSPDGKTALSAGADNVLILWDLASGHSIRTFAKHDNIVMSVAFSPDGKTALSASQEETNNLILWDIASGKALHTFAGHTKNVNAVAFSPDGKTAVSASDDQTMILWDMTTYQPIRTFTGHTAGVLFVAFRPGHPDQIMSGADSEDNSMILWDVATAKPIRTFKGHDDAVNAIAFSPDGAIAVSAGHDNKLIMWDVESGAQIHTLLGHSQKVYGVAYSPDGQTILSSSADGTIRQWDVDTGLALRTFAGHGGAVRSVAFSPDGRQFLSGAADTTVRLWDLVSGAALGRIKAPSVRVFSPDGKIALGQGKQSEKEYHLVVWDMATGKAIVDVPGHTDSIQSIALSPDGTQALSGSGDQTMILWDIKNGKQLHVFKAHTDKVWSVAFSPDGKRALSASKDSTLILWDLTTYQNILTLRGHEGAVQAVAFSPDGKTALSGSKDQVLILWDLSTGQPIRTFKGHTSLVETVAFSPDGKTALSGGDDKTLILWDIATGKPIRTFTGHNGTVFAVAFSPDGKLALSGAGDNDLILWDVAQGQPLRRFEGHNGAVQAVKFGTDKATLFSASADQSVRLWRLDTSEQLLAWAQQNRYIPPLTCDQERNYRLEPKHCDAAGGAAGASAP